MQWNSNVLEIFLLDFRVSFCRASTTYPLFPLRMFPFQPCNFPRFIDSNWRSGPKKPFHSLILVMLRSRKILSDGQDMSTLAFVFLTREKYARNPGNEFAVETRVFSSNFSPENEKDCQGFWIFFSFSTEMNWKFERQNNRLPWDSEMILRKTRNGSCCAHRWMKWANQREIICRV